MGKKTFLFGIFIFFFTGIHLLGGTGWAAGSGSKQEGTRSEAVENRWMSINQTLRKDYDVCVEHCAKDKACLLKCEKAYKARLGAEYEKLRSEKVGSIKRQDIDQHASCRYCGMNRDKFSHSRVYIEYDDGSTFGACSIHCAAVDMALNIDKGPMFIGVGDYDKRDLIDAEKAVWVIGGSKMGVMTKRAKWAFESRADADRFIGRHGGAPATFEEAVKAAYEDMYQDTKMIRDKRKAMRMKMMKSGD